MHEWPPYTAIHEERIRAHAKHDLNGGSMERLEYNDPAWLPVVAEEFGEVARALCEYRHGHLDEVQYAQQLRTELIQLGAMVAAWLQTLS